jgi:hypothetical protein
MILPRARTDCVVCLIAADGIRPVLAYPNARVAPNGAGREIQGGSFSRMPIIPEGDPGRITACNRYAACWKGGLCFDGQGKLELKRAFPCNIMQEARHTDQRDMEATMPHAITRPEKNLNNLDFFAILQSR